jgi:ERCC4-type nuclease
MAKKKAKNPSNQGALDRLHVLLDNTSSTNYVYTLRRAIDSVATCPRAIENRKQACELRGVGPQVAKVVCPQETTTTTTTTTATKKATSKKSSGSCTDASSSISGVSRRPLPAVSSSSLSSDGDWKKQTLSAKQVAYDNAVKEASSLKLPSGPWKVVLLLDGREQRAEHVQAKLQMSGIPCEQRHLPIGDMAWLARSGNVEIMLGTIVERKEVNDLAQSLFGTRYLEQRLRLQHCGLPQVLLLVEGNTSTVTNCPGDTLETAMMETRVMLDFQVITTRHLDDTVRLLKNVHRRILQRSFPSAFGDALPTSLPSFTSPNASRPRRKKKKVSLVDLVFDTPPVPPLGEKRFVTYTELKTRVERDREAGTRTVGATHAAMLKQIPTLSLKKVQAILSAYPTPAALYRTYVGLTEDDGKTLVQDFTTKTGIDRICRVGPNSAAELYYTCTEGASELEGEVETAVESSSGATTSTGSDQALSQESAVESVARMPNHAAIPVDESSFSPFYQDFVSSPLHEISAPWSKESADATPTVYSCDSTPRKPSPQESPTSPRDEMDLALQRRREKYQTSLEKKNKPQVVEKSAQDDGFVDLTQGDESDTEDNVDRWQQSQGSSQDAIEVLDDEPHVSSVAASVPSSSQGNSSVEEEPLYVRCQRLHQARAAVMESRKRRIDSSQEKSSSEKNHTAEVIEIE